MVANTAVGELTTDNVLNYDEEKARRKPGLNIRQPAPAQNVLEKTMVENLELKHRMVAMTFERVFPILLRAFVDNGVPLKTDRPDMMKLVKLCADSVEGVIAKYFLLPMPIEVIADNFYVIKEDGIAVFKPYDDAMKAAQPPTSGTASNDNETPPQDDDGA